MNTTDVGSTPQLFLDDHVVERMDGVQRQYHRPVREPDNPLVEADQPWEQGGNGVYLYGGTVLYDEEDQIFKLWYRTSVVSEDPTGRRDHIEGEEAYKACYATSKDGVHWEKPDLGLHELDGSTHNNVLPPSKDGSGFIRRPNLMKDYEETDPNRRYKMIYMDYIDDQWGLSKGYSADGLHWEMNVGEHHRFEEGVAPNGIFFGWDPKKRYYAQFHRKGKAARADVDGRMIRRRVATVRTTSSDFDHWDETVEVIRRPDDEPSNWSLAHGVDLAAILYTEDLYVGFIDTCSTYHVEDVPEELWNGVYGSEFEEYRTEMVYSRDGDEWTRLAPHWEFMPKGLWGTWDRMLVGMAKPIVTDDEVLFYYTGRNVGGNAQNPRHPQNKLMHQIVDGQRMGYAIGLARMRRDGFVSIDGYDPGGTLTTRPITFEGDKLIVNARAPERAFGAETPPATPHGHLDVEVLDGDGRPVDGFSAADFDTFTGDDVRHVAAWNGSSDLGRFEDSPIRLRFHQTNTALYGFHFAGDQPATPPMNLLAPGAKGHPRS